MPLQASKQSLKTAHSKWIVLQVQSGVSSLKARWYLRELTNREIEQLQRRSSSESIGHRLTQVVVDGAVLHHDHDQNGYPSNQSPYYIHSSR